MSVFSGRTSDFTHIFFAEKVGSAGFEPTTLAFDDAIKAKLSLPWTGPFQILAVGPAAVADTPDGRPLGSHLLYLELPSDMPGPKSRARVSVYRCKPCHSAHDIDDFPAHLPAALSKYVLHSFGKKCPPSNLSLIHI